MFCSSLVLLLSLFAVNSLIVLLAILVIIILIEPVKTGPSFADAAVGRIAQSTKVLAEGGYEKNF